MTVDLRSDTVTKPTREMLEAMLAAELGDDVLGDDPTVTRLEERVAEITGHQAGLFVPSGTMGNQIALAVHCPRGEAAIFEEQAHMLHYEVGASATLAGAVSFTLPGPAPDPEAVRRLVLQRSLHSPGTTLLCLENTHNRHGGAVIDVPAMAAYRALCDEAGIRLHMDGARVWHAAVALGVPVRDLTHGCDSVSVCLSKGLRAPVGSVLCGSAEFIDQARRWRKRLGGGMRQAGLLAACGIVAVTRYVDRLAEDHARAKRVAQALQGIPGLQPVWPETNILLLDTARPAVEWQAELEAEGVRCLPFGPHRVRLVFHADVDDRGADHAIGTFRRLATQELIHEA